ncbi:hypothetical protein CWB89_22415 [Pseudoalteromonas piscicida]|uniref:Uncharacterized protein n=1 Tax=Pseudoalteromonas piscicida TaxID=43662 RepID=A0AAQ2ISH0_PSEO7|nr:MULTISPECIES: hypothetical protein [Pseudoalteromonas]KJY86000.1 hypothetical protein TW75_18170 [Pseudoalteromonas piscicida]MDP4489992.1 hypothetical protein [Pseudoalteromonas piscicida]TMN36465.1 hypothetical protein CWB95_17625 [Pseudoalteromonas piscicida]TMN43076.1 hypothetical protein CWB94_03885 [Pseudoalteromonas piscicida]TMN54513.1 hypothetical protein CWB91_08485 [Pseudoalteromonas piscicida]
MKLTLNKKCIKALSNDSKSIPANMTPQIAGGDVRANSPAGSLFTDRYGDCWTGRNHSCREHTCQIP